MASPFAVFRRHQAAFLVIFGVLIIVIFTIGDSVSRLTDTGGGQNKDPVVVRWEGTELTESQLQGLQYAQRDILNALYQVQNAAIAKGAFPRFLQQAAMRQQMGLPISRPGMIFTENDLNREEIVRTRILATWASGLGILVPETEIAEHLRQISDNKLSWEEIREILRGGKNGQYTRSIKAFNAMIREKLLAQKAISLSFASLGELTPGQQFGYFARSNRQIEIDVLEIPVSEFIDQISEPDQKELEAYFARYKYQEPIFNNIAGVSYESPEPGFKLPHRVSVDYVKVNVDREVAKWIDQVTDEEIAAYYEENKRMDERLHVVDALKLPSAEDFEQTGEASDEKAPETKKESESPSSAGPEEKKTVPAKTDSGSFRGGVKIRSVAFFAPQPVTEDKGAEDKGAEDKGAEDKGAEDKAAEDKAAEDKGAEDKGAEDKGAEDKGAEDKGAEDKAAEDKGAEDKGAEDKGAEDKAAEDKGAEDKAAEDKAAEDEGVNREEANAAKSDDEKQSLSTSGQDAPAATDSVTADGAAETEPPSRKEPTYKPLEEVRDYVRQKVAEKKASEAITSKFTAIRRRVAAYAAARQYEEGRDIAAPSVDQLAESQGLDGFSVPLQAAWSLQRDTEIGRSVQRQPQSRNRPFGGEVDYTSLVFQEGEQTFWQAIETTDDENNRYLSWKIDEKLPETPALDGPERERVVRVWKEGAGREGTEDTARKRAIARAEEMLVRFKGGESFDAIAAAMPGSRRMATEAFAWLTGGSAPMMNPFAPARLRLSQIDGVDQPGAAFMEAAFALDMGEAGVGINHPQTHVYLMQVTFQNKSSEVLEQDFLNSLEDPRTGREVQSAAQLDWQLLGERWFDNLDRSVGLQWLNPAARFGR